MKKINGSIRAFVDEQKFAKVEIYSVAHLVSSAIDVTDSSTSEEHLLIALTNAKPSLCRT